MPRNKVIDIHPSDEHQVEVGRRTHTRTLMFFFDSEYKDQLIGTTLFILKFNLEDPLKYKFIKL